MGRFVSFCIIALTVSGGSLFAQNISIPFDSIQTLLCKKWEVDYAVMGGMKVGRMPGAEEINYEFNKDRTFIISGKDPKEKKKGTWSYDPKKKLIKLTVDGRNSTSIISLTENEFVMLADTKTATPDDPTDIRIVYKPSTK
jgi:hypothetical protein